MVTDFGVFGVEHSPTRELSELEIQVLMLSDFLDKIVEAEHNDVVPTDIYGKWKQTTNFGVTYYINYDSSIPKIDIDLTFKKPIYIIASFEINEKNVDSLKSCKSFSVGPILTSFSYNELYLESNTDPILTQIYANKFNTIFNRLLTTHGFYDNYFKKKFDYLRTSHQKDLMDRYIRMFG